jgi:ketosteroid isomerase-like protein
MPSKEQMIATLNDVWAAVEAQDIDRMLGHMAEDAELEDPVGSGL